MIKRMLNKVEHTIKELREHFNKKIENVIKNQSEVKNIVTEMKKTLEGTHSRLVNTEEWISDLEDRIVKFTQSEQQMKKEF